MAALAFAAAAGVALAVAGLDAEAIVLGALAGAAATSLLLLFAAPPPLPRWHRRRCARSAAFGLPASAAGLTSVAITNSTLAVAAVRLTATQAGLFWRAFQLGVVYQEKISGIMIRLAFPVYSRTTDLTELRRFHERATRIHAAVLLPLLAILIVVAPELVPWLFGAALGAGRRAGPDPRVAGMIAAVLTGYPQIMLAAGRPRVLLIFNIALLALYVSSPGSPRPTASPPSPIAVVGVHVVLLVAVYAGLFRGVLGIPVRRLVTDLFPAVVGSVAAARRRPAGGRACCAAHERPVFLLLARRRHHGGLVYLAALCASSRRSGTTSRARPDGSCRHRPSPDRREPIPASLSRGG